MSLLSLGLLKDEREDVAREGKGSGRELSSSSISKGADNGTAESRAFPSFDPVATDERAGEGTRPYASSGDGGLSDKSVRPTQDQTGGDARLPKDEMHDQAGEGARRPTQEAVSHLPPA